MANIKKESFGKLSDGREVQVYTLRNNKGNELKVTDFGARIVSLRFRDKNFTNKFVVKTFSKVGDCENNFDAGIVLVDGGTDFAKVIWNLASSTKAKIFLTFRRKLFLIQQFCLTVKLHHLLKVRKSLNLQDKKFTTLLINLQKLNLLRECLVMISAVR